MRLPRMTVRKCMVIVALAALIFAMEAKRRRQDRHHLEFMTHSAISRAKDDLGDLSQFDMTAKWIGDDARIDFVPRMPGQIGRRYPVCWLFGEVHSTQPLSKP